MFFNNRYKKMISDFKPERPPNNYIRINTLKGDEEKIKQRLLKKGVKLEKGPIPQCYKYESEFSIATTTEHLKGLFYIQGLASQIVAHTINPSEKWLVVDMAAAPGSKTTHLAQLMKDRGRIIAFDNNQQRLNAVVDNCSRLGVSSVITLIKDSRYADEMIKDADAVLLDAPCSGNYCSEEGWSEKRRIGDIQQNSRIQKELLKSASKIVKKGGIILYSTCSLEPEENEMVIDWAIKNLGLELKKIKLPELGLKPGLTSFEGVKFDDSLKKSLRSWPHLTGTEGFFIALLYRK